jgi:hypothetical protein
MVQDQIPTALVRRDRRTVSLHGEMYLHWNLFVFLVWSLKVCLTASLGRFMAVLIKQRLYLPRRLESRLKTSQIETHSDDL